ncbi:MAG: T9SS type A sorting domain-containing protein [Saprospiraceae bacterium]
MQNSNKIFIPFLFFLFFIFGKNTFAQDCQLPKSFGVLNGNNIRTSIPMNGNLFWTIDEDPLFQVVNPPAVQVIPNTFFTTGLWLAGKNADNDLKIAVAAYQGVNNHDYFSGPINNDNGQLSFQCDNYDRIWEVFGYEISHHISDFNDNGVINSPLENIYAYPAHQNPHFENIHGFALPNTTEGLAPFHDKNNDGIYNPDDGDFPLPENVSVEKIPQHIIWGVFNDGGGLHTESQGVPLNVEVQLTAYSFYCTDDDLLNNTIFTSHKVINRGNETLDSLIFTKWVDFDLGCYIDDFIGCIPNLNTFYVYNEDQDDGGPDGLDCPAVQGGIGYGSNPPVQAVTILNQEMSSFNVGGISSNPTPAQNYYLMQGKWEDGTPITQGGNGYGGTQPTSFIFPDNPNDPNGWAMTTTNLPYMDRRCIANVEIDNSLATNDFIKVDMAYTFYRDENLNHIQSVNLIYDHTPILQQLYDNNFEDCIIDACVDDCVWTGDANRDSIVSNFDILQIGLAFNESGQARNTPLVFQPFPGQSWGEDFNGIDIKHADCNSSGSIVETDFDWVETYYGKSYKLSNVIDEYPTGNELSITTLGNNPMDDMQVGIIGRAKIELNQAEDIYGLAFTLEFDPEYLKVILDQQFSPWGTQVTNTFSYLHTNDEDGELNYAHVKTDQQNSTTMIDELADIRFSAISTDFELVQTYLRIKNIRAILNNGDILDYGAQDFLVNINNPDGMGQVLSNENLEEANIQISPNPTSDILNVKMENPSKANFSIFDIYGKKVLERMEVNQNEIQISTSNFSSGVYFLKIEMDGKELVKKFIKI